jgi:transcriptional regulator with XRE-family HTH domain
MESIAKAVGQRIRNYRTNLGLSQEKLAELAGCHPTYIGQVERGEKNATLESVQAADKVRVAIITKNIAFVGGAQSDCTSLNGVLKRSFRLKRVWQARYRMCFECRNLSGGLSVICTLESVEKIAAALRVPLSVLLEKIGEYNGDSDRRNIPLECYEILAAKTPSEQEQILRIIVEIDRYKKS